MTQSINRQTVHELVTHGLETCPRQDRCRLNSIEESQQLSISNYDLDITETAEENTGENCHSIANIKHYDK